MGKDTDHDTLVRLEQQQENTDKRLDKMEALLDETRQVGNSLKSFEKWMKDAIITKPETELLVKNEVGKLYKAISNMCKTCGRGQRRGKKDAVVKLVLPLGGAGGLIGLLAYFF